MNLEINLGSVVILTISSLLIHEHGVSVYLSSLTPFSDAFGISVHKVLHLCCYIYPYAILLDATVNGAAFLNFTFGF